jgi:hypothetical protein
VARGKYLLENIFGAPQPPPPPDAGGLKQDTAGGRPSASVRESMEAHRKNPACASCHLRMDPLGFALENFDGIGKWRTVDAGSPVDSAAVLPDGTKIAGAAGLRDALSKHTDDFARTVAERLMTYALGRGIQSPDMPAVRRVVRDASSNQYRWSSLILGIVKSAPFQMRTAQGPAPVVTH